MPTPKKSQRKTTRQRTRTPVERTIFRREPVMTVREHERLMMEAMTRISRAGEAPPEQPAPSQRQSIAMPAEPPPNITTVISQLEDALNTSFGLLNRLSNIRNRLSGAPPIPAAPAGSSADQVKPAGQVGEMLHQLKCLRIAMSASHDAAMDIEAYQG